MATSYCRQPLAAICLLFTGLMLVGCQSEHPPKMVDADKPVFIQRETIPPPLAMQAEPSPQVVWAPPARPQAHPYVVPTVPPLPQITAGIPRDWIPNSPTRKWEWIVIHHSATTVGGAVRFGKEHMAKGWDELGYHFVVGNGTDTAVGAVEVGSRWPKQKQGAHCKTPDNSFNEKGIGICLVGNFDTAKPSEAQLKSAAKLVAYLMKTYHISADHVIGHGDAKATDCPGKNFHVAVVRRMSTQILVDAGDAIPQPVRTAAAVVPGQELLVDTRRPH